MSSRLAFGHRIALAMGATAAVTAVVVIVSVGAMVHVVSAKDHVIDVDSRRLVLAEQLNASLDRKSAAARAYMLAPQQRYLDAVATARQVFRSHLTDLDGVVEGDEQRMIREIETAEAKHQEAVDAAVAQRDTVSDLNVVSEQYETDVVPLRQQLGTILTTFTDREKQIQFESVQRSSTDANRAIGLIIALGAVTVLGSAVLALALTRSLRRQVGRTVVDVRSSSAELQATATEQAAGARQQATAMSEITTTINELLATSRQISESAQRVTGVAEQTTGAGRSGLDTVERADRSMVEIRHQVDLVVQHMLELGGKSQEIGAVLDIVSELAEQTNILAINSTIEAAGAGDAGRRFAVVADEIRKLADRVADSTKEIRSLIDEVRTSVNTTVMATEIGSKAVDAGSREFAEVSTSFRAISELSVTTAEAAREIELSTKQQTTAVEQVNVAIGDVAQATREAEAGTTQTARTASQLSTLSRDLLLLVDSTTTGA